MSHNPNNKDCPYQPGDAHSLKLFRACTCPPSAVDSTGDWYCRNCGYLSASRVTYSETCDTCHIPVDWLGQHEQSALNALQAELDAARADIQSLGESLTAQCKDNVKILTRLARYREALESIERSRVVDIEAVLIARAALKGESND